MAKLLKLSQVTQSYSIGGNTHTVLDRVDLDIKEGESVALIGSSGSGKTTLLHIASGLMKPESGHVEFLGEDFSQVSEEHMLILRQSGIGFMLQSHCFIPQMSVLENVALPLMVRNDPNAYEKALSILAVLQIPKRLHNMEPGLLSGGEQARIGLGRALVHSPKLLIADEPSAALDHELTQELFTYIEKMKQQQSFSILVATHDYSVLQYVNSVYKMESGKLKERENV